MDNLQLPFPTISLTNEPLRSPLEALVSQHIGHKWRIQTARDMNDYACHPCAILADDSYTVFAKFSDAGNGQEQFEVELAGLRLLHERSGVLIPIPVGVISVPGGSILVLEAVREMERTPLAWRQIGQALAQIHQVKGERFGLERNGFFGPLPQDNTPREHWAAFYAENRLQPGLRMAVDSGTLPARIARQVEKLITRLPEFCGPEPIPTLIHGDAQKNNFISTEKGAVVIDPAVYYGHPEMDLAYIDYFEPVPADVFDGYREILPIAQDFPERRDLWRVWGYLAAVSVEGVGYLDRLVEAVRKYG